MPLHSYSQLKTILYPTKSIGKMPTKISFSYEEQRGRNSQGDSTVQTETSANPRGPLGRYKPGQGITYWLLQGPFALTSSQAAWDVESHLEHRLKASSLITTPVTTAKCFSSNSADEGKIQKQMHNTGRGPLIRSPLITGQFSQGVRGIVLMKEWNCFRQVLSNTRQSIHR